MVADHACYQGNWICDETLVRLLTKQLPSLNDGIGLNLNDGPFYLSDDYISYGIIIATCRIEIEG